MVYLVTGGAGFIGSNLCERLLKLGKKVICVDNLNNQYSVEVKNKRLEELRKHEDFRFLNIDTKDFEALKTGLSHLTIDYIYNLASYEGLKISLEAPETFLENNLFGTLNLLKLAILVKAKKFIHGSASSVYGVIKKLPFEESHALTKPTSPYSASKRAEEQLGYIYWSVYKLPFISARIFTPYGPGMNPTTLMYQFIDLVYNEKQVTIFSGKNYAKDFIYIDDVVDGLISISDKRLSYQTINIGSGKSIRITDLVSLIGNKLNKKVKIKYLKVRSHDQIVTMASIQRAKKLLDFAPKFELEEGLNLTLEWYEKNHNKYPPQANLLVPKK